MFTKSFLSVASGEGKVIKYLSWQDCSNLLYTWKPDNLLSDCIFIRQFNLTTNEDKIVLVLNSSIDVISASLSPDNLAIVFTIKSSSNTKKQSIFPNSSKLKENEIKILSEMQPIRMADVSEESHSCRLLETTKPQENKQNKFNTFISNVFPTEWSMKFDGSPLRLQRAVFTDFIKMKSNEEISTKNYQVLFITHQKSIGLYNIILSNDIKEDSSVSNQNSTLKRVPSYSKFIKKAFRWRLYGPSTSEVISLNAFWSQWDSSCQRLYYALPIHKFSDSLSKISKNHQPNEQPFKFHLICLQFYRNRTYDKVFDIQLNGLSSSTLTCKDVETQEMSSTISSSMLAMEVLLFPKSGVTCVCWQDLAPNNHKKDYEVVVLDKNLQISCRTQQTEEKYQVSFFQVNSYLVVQSASFYHIYDVENIQENISNVEKSSFSLLLSKATKCFDANKIQQIGLTRLKRQNLIQTDAEDDIIDIDSVIYFDLNSHSIFNIKFDARKIGKMFYDDSMGLEAKLFITRQAVFMTQTTQQSADLLNEIIERLFSDPSSKDTHLILAQMFLAFTILELHQIYHNIPAFLMPIFPKILPTEIFKDFKQRNNQKQIEYSKYEASQQFKEQILKFIKKNANLVEEESFSGVKLADARKSLWYKTFDKCRLSLVVPYDLLSIKEEINFLQDSTSSGSQILQQRLNELFTRSFLSIKKRNKFDNKKLFRSNFLSFLGERHLDQKSKNVMALTYERLKDHLSTFQPDVNDHNHLDELHFSINFESYHLAYNYVDAQMCALEHVINLIIIKSGISQLKISLLCSISPIEDQLCTLLMQFQLACYQVSYPLPKGFHHLITSLNFRKIITRNKITDGKTAIIDVDDVTDQFLSYHRLGTVHISEEFVKRCVQELGHLDIFIKFIDALMKIMQLKWDSMSSTPSQKTLELLERWKHPYGVRLHTQMCMQALLSDGLSDLQDYSSNSSPISERKLLSRSSSSSSTSSWKLLLKGSESLREALITDQDIPDTSSSTLTPGEVLKQVVSSSTNLHIQKVKALLMDNLTEMLNL